MEVFEAILEHLGCFSSVFFAALRNNKGKIPSSRFLMSSKSGLSDGDVIRLQKAP